ncbi:ATP-binding protein [Sporomusa malonica]|nr:ATP-binding protein [Sporomusa malonica]
MLIWTYNNASRTHRLLLYEKEVQLAKIVSALAQRLPQSFEEILRQENVFSGTNEDKLRALNRQLQPIVTEVAAWYPGHNLGYYSPELKVVAVWPWDNSFLGVKASDSSLVVYETSRMETAYLNKSTIPGEGPLLAVTYPLHNNGKIVGHVWADIKTEDIESEFYFLLFRNLGIICAIWLAVLMTIKWTFTKLDKSLVNFVMQVKSGDFDRVKLQEFPQLVPVLDTVSTLRQHLANEFERREKVKEEMIKLDRLNLVSRMAAGVAHEIRNPMTVVMGFIQMMSNKADAKWRERALVILEELKHINMIVTDFLSLARNKRVDKQLMQLNQIIEAMAPLIYAESENRGIFVSLSLKNALPIVNLDGKEIVQLISNLTRNALEAMEQGGTFEISTLDHCGVIELCIRDNGCGISDEHLDKIFDPFYTTKDQATGLGLAVCKSIVDRHGGDIRIESNLGRGTTVIVSFRAADSQENEGRDMCG